MKRICIKCGDELEDDFQHDALCRECHIRINGNVFQKIIHKISKKLK